MEEEPVRVVEGVDRHLCLGSVEAARHQRRLARTEAGVAATGAGAASPGSIANVGSSWPAAGAASGAACAGPSRGRQASKPAVTAKAPHAAPAKKAA